MGIGLKNKPYFSGWHFTMAPVCMDKMHPNDRKRIQANYREIVRDLLIYEIVDALYQNEILDEEDIEYVDFMGRRLTPQEGNRILIRILFNRGPRAFSCFCKALENYHLELAEKIRNTDPGAVDSSIAQQSDPAFRQNELQNAILGRFQESLAYHIIALLVHDLLLVVLFIGMMWCRSEGWGKGWQGTVHCPCLI